MVPNYKHFLILAAIGSTILVSFSLFLSAPASFLVSPQASLRPGEVIIKEVEPFTYFSLRQKGPFTLIEATINQVIETARGQNVYPAGPLIAIFHSSPDDTRPEAMEWEVGFPVTPQALVQAPLEKKTWEFSPVAAGLHLGSYDSTGETIQKILDWMAENGYVQAGPILETYLDLGPSGVRPGELRTEIWIPCRKQTPF